MGDVWTRVGSLVGRTLLTPGRGQPGDVEEVDSHTVVVRVYSTGNKRRIPRSHIERGAALGLRGEELTSTAMRSGKASEFHPTYVAGILRAVEE